MFVSVWPCAFMLWHALQEVEQHRQHAEVLWGGCGSAKYAKKLQTRRQRQHGAAVNPPEPVVQPAGAAAAAAGEAMRSIQAAIRR